MDKLLLEELAGLQVEWETVSIRLREEKTPMIGLQDVRDYLYDLARIHSRSISLKTLLMSWSVTERGQYETSVKTWIMKGYAALERESLWTMSSEVATLLKKVDLIIEGCGALSRYLQHILTVFEIEAKLSYVGHN